MSAPCGPPWTAGLSSRRRGYADPSMRVSDADRTEVSDRLSRHYADGRLDQAEFDERVGKAMNAKTHGDFAGLFADLPDLPDESGTQTTQAPGQLRPGRHRGLLSQILLLALIVVAAIAISHAIVHSFLPWLRGGRRYRRRRI
jgi:hypothetical protein